MFSAELLNIGSEPFASGGFGDVYGGTTLNGSRVCIKRVRVYTKDPPKKAIKVRLAPSFSLSVIAHESHRPSAGRP